VGVSALEKQVVEGFSVHLIEGERPMDVKPTSLKTVSCTTPAQLRQPSKHLELEWGEPIPDLHGPRLCCTTNEASIIGGPGGGAPINTEFPLKRVRSPLDNLHLPNQHPKIQELDNNVNCKPLDDVQCSRLP
jgi:hypothetical protein